MDFLFFAWYFHMYFLILLIFTNSPISLEVRNSRVTKSSSKIELRKMTSTFELLTRKFLQKFFSRVTNSTSWNIRFHFEFLTRNETFFFQFQVNNSKLKYKKDNFELLTRCANFYCITFELVIRGCETKKFHFELIIRHWELKRFSSSYWLKVEK